MYDGPMDRPYNVNLDRRNGWRSNGQPMLHQFGPSKITVLDSYFGLLKNIVVDLNLGPFKIMVGDRNFKRLKIAKKKNVVKVVVNTTVGQLVPV